ncbi:unnamed protein product [Closterium sp. NIES-53]
MREKGHDWPGSSRAATGGCPGGGSQRDRAARTVPRHAFPIPSPPPSPLPLSPVLLLSHCRREHSTQLTSTNTTSPGPPLPLFPPFPHFHLLPLLPSPRSPCYVTRLWLHLAVAEREKELEVQYYLYSPFFPPFLLSPLPPSRISFPHPSLPACGGGARARLHIAVLEREKKELERQTHLFPPLASPLPASLLPPSPLYPIPSHQHAEEVARARLHIAVVEREKKDLEGLRASAGPEMLGVQREKEEAEERVREMEGVVMQLKTREREVGDAVWRCGSHWTTYYLLAITATTPPHLQPNMHSSPLLSSPLLSSPLLSLF